MSANDTEAVIGQDNSVVRVLNFSSGGYDAVMQLGVVHALLVIQGRAPDAIVGISAGAVNAVAAAEILQAGEADEVRLGRPWSEFDHKERCAIQRQRMEARTERFREVLRAYEIAPYEISAALMPDAYQIDTHRPLEPQRLPVHASRERDLREGASRAKAGLIGLYNQLLQVRLSVGTYTRAVRRILGIIGARELTSTVARRLAQAMEGARLWWLLRANLFRVVPLLPALMPPLFGDGRHRARGTRDRIRTSRLWAWSGLNRGFSVHDLLADKRPSNAGAPAGALISRSWFWSGVIRLSRNAAAFLVVGGLWVSITGMVVGLPFALWASFFGWAKLLAWIGTSVAVLIGDWTLAFSAFQAGESAEGLMKESVWISASLAIYAILVASLLIAVILSDRIRNGWSDFVDFNHSTSFGIAKELLFGLLGVLFLFGWSLFVGLLLVAGMQTLAAWGEFRGLPEAWPVLRRILVLAFIALLLLIVYVRYREGWREYHVRLLARYGVGSSLFDPHAIRQFLVRLFDPGYYGTVEMSEIVDDALNTGSAQTRERKKNRGEGAKGVAHYSQESRVSPVHVGLAVADVADGSLTVIPNNTPVIDGLIAATAVTPLFPMQKIEEKWYLDGATISKASIRPALQLLRKREVNPTAKYVRIFSVNAVPLSKPPEATADERHRLGLPLNLVDTVSRAKTLQRYRDASLETTLTEVYTRALPEGSAKPLKGENCLRAWVTPIEPERPLGLNRRVLAADRAEGHRLIREAVADGCRAALEAMISDSQRDYESGAAMTCRQAVLCHLKSRLETGDEGLDGLSDEACKATLDTNPECGPGISEVCEECAIRPANGAEIAHRATRMLQIWDLADQPPAPWPHERELKADTSAREPTRGFVHSQGHDDETGLQCRRSDSSPNTAAWPEPKLGVDGRQRPLVNVLFSGGVFRGVYQLGVLSALSELNVRPDLVAGASVGSITAAMAAETFAGDQRRQRIAEMAAAYLAIDRLVLTDRFADLVRTATVRAGSTRFSLHQADRFFRRYDSAASARFMRDARTVVAGLERLFYLSPFELADLVRAFRENRPDRVFRFLKDGAQEWLDRMGVGVQVLGAEPLELLIEQFVTSRIRSRKEKSDDTWVPFSAYRDSGICLLATATDLTEGSLRVLGGDQLNGGPESSLVEGLLASSAFPGVFRPRSSSELQPLSATRHDYIDGGVMDNLPLHAVTDFLWQGVKSSDQVVCPRPEVKGVSVPHLVLATSLRVDPKTSSNRPEESHQLQQHIEELNGNWLALWQRARRLQYNKKLSTYAAVQKSLRRIVGLRNDVNGWQPLDLQVVTVRPSWLCGTFAFHPMLGFRRAKQAASVAHGCYTTFEALAGLHQDLVEKEGEEKADVCMKYWGINVSALPKNDCSEDKESEPEVKKGDSEEKKSEPEVKGLCWHRQKQVCPFSQQALDELQLETTTKKQLSEIYSTCEYQPEFHPTAAGKENGSRGATVKDRVMAARWVFGQ